MKAEASLDVAELIESSPLNPFHLVVLINTALVMFIEGYDMQVASFAAPAILKTWHLSSKYFGPVFGLGLFGNLLGGTVLGHLGDRLGRKKVLLAGTVAFGIFTLAAAFASSVSALAFLRFLAGIGIGASIPAAIALAIEYAPASLKSRVTSFLFLGYTMGGMIGGLIAARLIPKFGWPSVFVVGGIGPVAVAIAVAFSLPESLRFLAIRQKGPRQMLAILRRLAPSQTFDSVTVFTITEEHHPGLPVRQLFRNGRALTTALLWIAFVSSLLGHYFLTSWLPTILTRAAAPLAYAIVAGALLQGGGGIGGIILCWLSDKRNMLWIAFAYAIACPLIVFLPFAHGAGLLWMAFLVGFFLVGGQIGLNAIAGTIYPTDLRSTGVGWALGIGRIGSIAGPVLGGFLLSSHVPIHSIFLYTGMVAPICAAAVFLVFRTVPGPSRHERLPSLPAQPAQL